MVLTENYFFIDWKLLFWATENYFFEFYFFLNIAYSLRAFVYDKYLMYNTSISIYESLDYTTRHSQYFINRMTTHNIDICIIYLTKPFNT